ncbi:MAG: hypothetical protein JJLCMIEE_01507 [Acidimicrobiales bacterium]|nr:hypothetical protein [Acidimicrobiales bacterium]
MNAARESKARSERCEGHALGGPELTRRRLLAGTLVGAGAVAAAQFLQLAGAPRVHAAFAQAGSPHVLIVVFLRGGADGLSILPPLTEPVYHDQRPTIAIPENLALPVDAVFGLHPVAARLAGHAAAGRVCFVPACGSPHPSRSHFDAQAIMEAGTQSLSASDGWLARHLLTTPPDSNVEAVAVSDQIPVSMMGHPQALAAPDVEDFGIVWAGTPPEQTAALLRGCYSEGADLLSVAARNALAAVETMSAIEVGPVPEDYDQSWLGRDLWQVRTLIDAGVGVQGVAVDVHGWDTHDAMGGVDGGRMRDQVEMLDVALGAFLDDMAGRTDYTLVVMTEFGRRVAQNDSDGTDHGHGGVMVIAGEGVSGPVAGSWPGLGVLDRGDVQVVNDYRLVLAEVLDRRCGNPAPSAVFPDLEISPADYLGVFAP